MQLVPPSKFFSVRSIISAIISVTPFLDLNMGTRANLGYVAIFSNTEIFFCTVTIGVACPLLQRSIIPWSHGIGQGLVYKLFDWVNFLASATLYRLMQYRLYIKILA